VPIKVCFPVKIDLKKSDLKYLGFPSFKNLLLEVSFPQLASTMALNDENQVVRAAAFKCLQEIIVWEDIDKLLPRSFFVVSLLLFF